jgi:hypothetical protein
MGLARRVEQIACEVLGHKIKGRWGAALVGARVLRWSYCDRCGLHLKGGA